MARPRNFQQIKPDLITGLARKPHNITTKREAYQAGLLQ
jgi:hypothetical protein